MSTAPSAPARNAEAMPWSPAASGRSTGPAGHRGWIIAVEGLWGSGKSTVGRAVGQALAADGFDTTVIHYGPRHGVHVALSELLEQQPLRERTGLGGYTQPGHATVDALLRLCREADTQRQYRDAARDHQVVIVDHGIYAKLAYCLTVLAEQHPGIDKLDLFTRLSACTEPWWLHPDLAIHLDTPWPLARERAIARGHGGGNPAAIERLLFLPALADSYRTVLAAQEGVRRIRVGLRSAAEVTGEATTIARTALRIAHQQEGNTL